MIRQLIAILLLVGFLVTPVEARRRFVPPPASAPPPSSGFTYISSVGYSTYPSDSSTTSPAISTTGAKLIVVGISTYQDWYATALSDSAGNTSYTQATKYSSNNAVQYWYLINPSNTSGSTTWTPTFAGPKNYARICVFVFNCSGTPVFDTENGRTSNATFTTGSITPAVNGAVIIAGGFNYATGSGISIDNSFDLSLFVDSGSNIGAGGDAYKIQATAAAINPTLSNTGWTGSGNTALHIIAFKF